MRHVFIVNPTAGKRDMTEEIRELAKAAFDKRGESYTVERTERRGHAIEIAARYAADGVPTRFYACGGDGTLNEVVNGMYTHDHCSVAPYPCGTGNDLIKSLGSDAKARYLNIEALADGEVCRIDLISGGDRIGINVTSVGFDLTIGILVERFKRLPFINGTVAYIMALFYGFFTSMRFRYSFVADGEEIPEGDFIFAVFCNGKYYGGGFHPAPQASLQDGFFNLVLIRTVSRFRVLGLIGAYKKGTHLRQEDIVLHRACRHVKMRSPNPLIVGYEGEAVEYKNLDMRILPAALQFTVPRGYSDLSREYGKIEANM